MRHWSEALNAASSIVEAKRIEMDQNRLIAYLGVGLIAVILIAAVVDAVQSFKTKDENAPTIPIPKGARVLIIPTVSNE